MGNMNNVEFFILLGTVLAGVIWQRVDAHYLNGRIDQLNIQLSGRIERINDDLLGRIDQLNIQLSGRIDRINDDLSGRIDRISDDMKQFYRTLGQHDARLDNIEKK